MNAEPRHDPLGVFLGGGRPPDESAVAAWAREAMPRDLHAAWRNAARRVGWLLPDHEHLETRERATWWIWRFARPDGREREWSPVVASAWVVETSDGRRPWERLDVFPSRAEAVAAATAACGFQATGQEVLF